MFDVVALGESLIDFTPNGTNAQGIELFARNPGGAPANVLAMNARLGGKTAFIGKVGKDGFGDFLRQTLVESSIDVSGLVIDEKIPTTLAFVQLDSKGDRSFTFYRNPGADVMLTSAEVNRNLIDDAAIFHFGSVSLTADPSRTATLEAADAVVQMQEGVKLADLLKVSEEEMQLITNESDLARGSQALLEMGPSLVLVSLGAKGAYYRNAVGAGYLPTYDVPTVDTTGAGDAFMGAIHYQLRRKAAEDLRTLPAFELEEIVRFGNAAGSLTTTKGGAIPAMPSMVEIQNCIASIPLL